MTHTLVSGRLLPYVGKTNLPRSGKDNKRGLLKHTEKDAVRELPL